MPVRRDWEQTVGTCLPVMHEHGQANRRKVPMKPVKVKKVSGLCIKLN